MSMLSPEGKRRGEYIGEMRRPSSVSCVKNHHPDIPPTRCIDYGKYKETDKHVECRGRRITGKRFPSTLSTAPKRSSPRNAHSASTITSGSITALSFENIARRYNTSDKYKMQPGVFSRGISGMPKAPRRKTVWTAGLHKRDSVYRLGLNRCEETTEPRARKRGRRPVSERRIRKIKTPLRRWMAILVARKMSGVRLLSRRPETRARL